MFDKKSKDAYLNIKAPLRLKDKVLSTAQSRAEAEALSRKKNFSKALKSLSAVAACLVLVLTVMVVYRNSANTSFYVDGQKLSDEAVAVRTANEGLAKAFSLAEEEGVTVNVPVEMKLKGKAKIDISEGAVIKSGEYEPTAVPFEAEGELKLEWVIDSAAQGTVYTLTVEDKGEKSALILEYGKDAQGWEVRLERLD